MPVSLHYKKSGSGPTLLILHGLFGSLDNWVSLSHQFSAHFTVYLIDLRNHGKSPHSDEHHYEVIAEDLHLFMEVQQIKKANIIGHSMGGKAAMQFCKQYPENVEKMVIVDIAPRAYSSNHEVIFQALLSLQLDSMQSRNDADETLKLKIPDFATRQFLLKNLKRNEKGKLEWKFNLYSLYKNYNRINESLLFSQKINNSTLFVLGEKSNYILNEDRVLIQENFNQVKFAKVANAGHWVHAENSTDFYTITKAFLIEN